MQDMYCTELSPQCMYSAAADRRKSDSLVLTIINSSFTILVSYLPLHPIVYVSQAPPCTISYADQPLQVKCHRVDYWSHAQLLTINTSRKKHKTKEIQFIWITLFKYKLWSQSIKSNAAKLMVTFSTTSTNNYQMIMS